MDLLGKNISELEKPFKYETFTPDYWNLKNVKDDSYISKNKFVIETSLENGLGAMFIPFGDADVYFDVINIPPNVEKIFFSGSYKANLILGGFVIRVYQLKGNFQEYMSDFSLSDWKDYENGLNSIFVENQFENNKESFQIEINLNKDTTQILMMIAPTFDYKKFVEAISSENKYLRSRFNDLFNNKPKIELFIYPDYSFNLEEESYTKKRITYFTSNDVPNIPPSLENYDFSNVWLCENNITDENNNLIYESGKLYGLKTIIDYWSGNIQIVGWERLNFTKEDADAGYEHYFFVGYRIIKKDIHSESDINGRMKGTMEFGDIMFSTINYEWAPAEGESAVETEFKFNTKGMYIENNEEGFRREISASRDVSTNLQTGENTWFLTPQGQWVKLLEAKEIRMGNYHAVEENDEINIYYRGGN